MRKFKKLISVILTVMMIMSVMPVSMVGAEGDISSQSSASVYPAGAIGLFYEDFESGYTLNENWVKDDNKVTISGGDNINYSFGNWDFQSNLNGQTTNTGDSISVVDVSNLNLGGGFSGNALKLRNERASAYGKNYFGFRRNFNGTTGISLTSGEYAGKKLVYEVDVKVTDSGLGSYTSDKQEMFLLPSRQEKIYDYPNSGQWKGAIRLAGNQYRMEMGSGLPNIGYHSAQISNVTNNVGHFKFVLDQTADVDVMNIWYNDTQFTQTFKANVDNPYSGLTTGDLYAVGFNGQAFDFGSTILGLWGTANGMEYYIDNLKAYLVDEFEIESANAKATGFDPATDKVEIQFANEIDATTVESADVVLLNANGTEVEDGIASVALKNGDNKTLEVAITEAVLGETTYKVEFRGGLKDIYGFSYETVYALDSTSGLYTPQMKTANTTATFETCTLLEYESATPENESITEYVQGQDQEITLYFNDTLADTVDIANAFEVKDEAGNAVTGLGATFGATKDIVVLQLKDLVLGEGKHTIKSKEHALFNANNKYANIAYVFDTLDFTAKTYDDIASYMPKTEETINVELSLPTVLTNENILSGFEVVDGDGNAVAGLAAELINDGKVVTLSLAGLDVEKGSVTIKSTPALVDNRGRNAEFELTFDIIEFNVSVSESSGFQLKPGENKEVVVTLSLPTVLTAENIASGFEVVTQSGSKVNGLGVTLSGDAKTVTLQLKDLVVENGKYFIKSTSALADSIGRIAEINLMFNVAKEVILFEEDFEFGYTLNENWINNDNEVSAGKYSVANGAWDIQSNNATDSVSVVAVDGLELGAGFTGNALRLYNDAATKYNVGYFSFRRNFNGTSGISLTSGEYAGKKLVYEADIYVKNVAGKYTADHQSSLLAVSKNQGTIHDYSNGQWKPTIQSGGQFRVEEGSYATASYGPLYMWYATPASAHKYGEEAGKLKIILDQTGVVDTISVYANGQLLTSTRPAALDGHKMSGLESSALLPSGYQGQEFNFADTIYGIWGSPSDMEIYVDNFKAYLIDSFSIASVEVDGNKNSYEASTDSVVYKFTGEVDPASVKDAVEIYDAEGNAVPTALKSATLEDSGKTLRVVLAKSVAGESEYKVVLNDSIKDIYGSDIANNYEWYEYPINEYYEATGTGTYMIGGVECNYTPKTADAGAKMSLATGERETFVDCWVPVPSKDNREISFTTSRKIKVTNVTPAVVPGYDLGRDQKITITLAEALDGSINLAEAFTVTDEDGKNIEGLAASFGETTDTIILQLSGLALGNGKHFIESVDGALANAEGIFANVSISVSTVDFMVTYAEPGSEVLTEYKEGDDQKVVLGLSSPSVLNPAEFATGFEVVDEDGVVIPGIQATYNTNNAERTDDDTIVLQLSGLKLGKGKHTIRATDKLIDRRGRALTFEYIFSKLPFKAEYETTVSDYEPKTDKELVINLTYELDDASITNINNAFIVENSENLRVSGLKATVSEDKKAIKLQLKDLDISGGEYKITSKSGLIFSKNGEELAGIMIKVDTGSGAAFGPSEGEGAGSGAPLDPETDFSTVVLLDENFENSVEKAEKGIEFVPSVNWYTSPEKIPYGFKVEKKGTEYRDAKIAVVPDPSDPSNGNMVLMNDTGYYAKDGSVNAGALSSSSPANYTILSRNMDKTVTIPKDKYTQVRMSSRIYVPEASMNYVPLSDQKLRNAEYIIAGTSNAGKTINGTNFAKASNGSPKFHMYDGSASSTSTGATGGFDHNFTANEWHTMEYVFSMYEYVKDAGAWKGGFQVYIDGVAVKNGIAFLSNDYNTINGMMSRIVAAQLGGSVVVYYDDWKIALETKYTTHVDTPSANVPENQDITLTLTKALNAESVKLIEDSLKDDKMEDLVIVKDADGNAVKANVTITGGNVITVDPVNGLKYNTEYIVEVKNTIKVNGAEHMLKATDGEVYKGIAYPFATAKAKDTYIDAEASAASFNCFSPDMGTATRFAYTMNLSGVHAKDVIAAVAVFNEKEELIGIEYKTIPAGSTQTTFDFTTRNGKTGGKVTRMYIWEAKSDGSRGRLMQSPDEITSR